MNFNKRFILLFLILLTVSIALFAFFDDNSKFYRVHYQVGSTSCVNLDAKLENYFNKLKSNFKSEEKVAQYIYRKKNEMASVFSEIENITFSCENMDLDEITLTIHCQVKTAIKNDYFNSIFVKTIEIVNLEDSAMEYSGYQEDFSPFLNKRMDFNHFSNKLAEFNKDLVENLNQTLLPPYLKINESTGEVTIFVGKREI